MKVTLNRSVCMGSGNCVQIVGAVFDQDPEDGKAVLRLQAVTGEAETLARRAAEFCPVGAITLSQDG